MVERNADDIDLAEVHRLVAALERDLQKIDEGSGDVSALREEVRALAEVLQSPAPDRRHVARRLHATHGHLGRLIESASLRTADYISRIGRMLGM